MFLCPSVNISTGSFILSPRQLQWGKIFSPSSSTFSTPTYPLILYRSRLLYPVWSTSRGATYTALLNWVKSKAIHFINSPSRADSPISWSSPEFCITLFWHIMGIFFSDTYLLEFTFSLHSSSPFSCSSMRAHTTTFFTCIFRQELGFLLSYSSIFVCSN